MQDMRIAAVTMRSEVGKTDKNLAGMEEFVQEAHLQSVDIICFPEMCATGYSIEDDILSCKEPVPGYTTDAVLRMAKNYDIVILGGIAEKLLNGGLSITHFAVAPQGILGVYRKIHIGKVEQRLYQPGRQVPVFKFGDFTFGIELCYDAHFPELSTILALKGAEAIFIPHASPMETPAEKKERWNRYMPARAYDNSLFVVACNQADLKRKGLAFPGVAMIIDPCGRLIKEFSEGGEGMIIADLKAGDLNEVRGNGKRFFMQHRKPEIYEDLMAPMVKGVCS